MRQPPIDLARIVRVTQAWNPPSHYGIDYSCVVGTPIYAAADGVVHCGTDPAGFGTYVRIDTGTHYVYAAHLWTVAVREGQQVTAGQVIGASGNTGNSTGPHLHFEVRDKAGSPWRYGAIDPGLWLMEDDMTDENRERLVTARWNAEEAVRQIEQTIESLQAARKRLVEETIPKLYEVEGQGT